MVSLLFLSICLLLLQWGFVLWNHRHYPALPPAAPDQTASTPISVLIPARNEATRIGDCLRSVLRQRGLDHLEVIVLDDGSTDATAAQVEQIAAQDARVRLIRGQTLPAGWMGKAYACHQLAQRARGTWLLFLDADVRLLPDAVIRTLQVAQKQKRGLVTGFPYQQLHTWLEKWVVPMMMFTISCHLPLRWVSRSPRPAFAAAHGGYLFIHRDSYDAIGGHVSFKQDLLDDMAMARAVKRAGHPLALIRVHDAVHMRMYERAAEVWNGYKKNLYPGIGRNPVLLFGMILYYSWLYLLPPVALVASLWHPAWLFPALIGTLLGIGIKRTVDRANGLSGSLAPLIPFSIGMVILIALDSWRSSFTGGYTWKGRRYT
jgi:glycosyltransferase involved in cell wall biosynthesis